MVQWLISRPAILQDIGSNPAQVAEDFSLIDQLLSFLCKGMVVCGVSDLSLTHKSLSPSSFRDGNG